MAGIGFVLRKLTRKDDLMGVAQAYTHAAIASAGPWLMTVFALYGAYYLSSDFDYLPGVETFRLIIIYNFAFSVLFTGPIYMTVTRYLADCIHDKNLDTLSGSMIGALLLAYAIQLPIVIFFYGFYWDFETPVRILAIINYMLVSSMWVVCVFIASLKDYWSISFWYFVGMALAVLLMPWLGHTYGVAGMVASFTIGLTVIVFPLTALVFMQYGAPNNELFAFTPYFRRYWELAASGFLYNYGIWIDKWIMWFAPDRGVHPSGMIYHQAYDVGMFLAYFTILPSLALFVFSVETSFFKKYLRYFRDMLQHANLARIKQNQEQVKAHVFNNTRGFIVLQGSICFLCFVMAPKIFEWLNLDYMVIGIFRVGTLGTFFMILSVFLMIVLSYFDDRKTVVMLQLLFAIANTLLTIISMHMGFTYYGVGFFLASVLSFGVSAFVVVNYLKRVTFHAFVTNNPALTAKL
ncbi:hypothetical protein GC177_04110 [bacterium]|nr:hypothetical protein [bacterium]